MRTVSEFPHEVEETEHLWIEMSDGTRLAARMWKPASADREPVPGVVEMIPYRERDLTAIRDSIHHPYMAGHGYASLRVDLRGSGDSEGVLTDEYLEQELFDAEQVASTRSPSLGAIVYASSTDDRYTDDVHYMCGSLLTDNLSWVSTMCADNACPPDAAIVGQRWREMWQQRIEVSGMWLET